MEIPQLFKILSLLLLFLLLVAAEGEVYSDSEVNSTIVVATNGTDSDEVHNSKNLNFTIDSLPINGDAEKNSNSTNLEMTTSNSTSESSSDSDEVHNSRNLNFTKSSLSLTTIRGEFSSNSTILGEKTDESSTDSDEIYNGENLKFTIKSRRKDVITSTNYTSKGQNLTTEDLKVRKDWGGYCMGKHWAKCSKEEYFHGKYLDEDGKIQDDTTLEKKINCKYLPYWCHINGWTVNKCHILCMSKCSKELLTKLDRYMEHEGECSYL